MRILLLSNMFAPEAYASAPLNTDACRFLVEAGHEVAVVTAFPHYPEWRVWPDYRGRIHKTEKTDGVEIRRIWSYVPRRPGTVGRILHYAVFAAVALPGCIGLKKPDVILCVTPPIELGITAWLLKTLWRVPFVLWIKDLVPEVAVQLGMMKNRQAIALARRVERFAYNRAAKLAVLCEGFRDYLLELGQPAEKVIVSPDWVNTEIIHPGADGLKFRRNNNISPDDFLVIHSGNIGAKQGLETVVRAAHALIDQPGIKFRIIGDGAAKADLAKEVAQLNLPNLEFLPIQPRDVLPEMLVAADVLLIHQKAAIVDSVIPSKLLTYLASGRPIVAGVNPGSETALAINRAGGGIHVNPESPDEMARAILALRNDEALRQRLGQSGRKFVEENFARTTVLSRLESVLYSTQVEAAAAEILA
jgi:colanic acid biosynthesis glycosyl transferase WcaI